MVPTGGTGTEPSRTVEPGLGPSELLSRRVVSQPLTGLRSTSIRHHRGGTRPDRQQQRQHLDRNQIRIQGSESRGLAEYEARFAGSAAPDVRWIRRDAAVICRSRPLHPTTNDNLGLMPAGSDWSAGLSITDNPQPAARIHKQREIKRARASLSHFIQVVNCSLAVLLASWLNPVSV